MPTIVSEEVRVKSLETEIPKTSFSLATVVPGVIMLFIGLATTFTPLGAFTASTNGLSGTLFIELLYYIGGATLITIGFLALVKQKMEKP